MNKKLMSVISVALALVLFVGSVEGLSRYRLDLIKVPVLKELKEDRTLISEEDIKWVKYPRKYIQDDTVLDADEIKGTYVKLNHTLYPDEPLSQNTIEQLDMSHDDAILRLHSGQSVFSIKTDLTKSFGGMLNVGHRVDISVVQRSRGEATEAKLFLSQVRVIGAKDKKGNNVDGTEIPVVILLAISNEALHDLLQFQAEDDLVLTLVERDLESECVLEMGFDLE